MSYRDYRLKSDNRCLADLLSMPPINLQKRDVYLTCRIHQTLDIGL
mgnify:FL=1